jgi:REP element-mobilizing transposase RayT
MYELNVELKYQRRSIRLKEYDYTMPGGYFITICTQNRDCLFGDFVRTGNQLNCTGCTGDRIIYTGDRPVAPIAAPPAKSPITPAKSEIILNEFGKIVRDEWLKTVDIRKEIVLDEFVVMPNHFHAIVFDTDISRTGNHINSAGGQLNCTGCTGDRPVAPHSRPDRPAIRINRRIDGRLQIRRHEKNQFVAPNTRISCLAAQLLRTYHP